MNVNEAAQFVLLNSVGFIDIRPKNLYHFQDDQPKRTQY